MSHPLSPGCSTKLSWRSLLCRCVLPLLFVRCVQLTRSVLVVQRALKEYVMSIDAAFAKQFEEFHVGFEGSFGSKHVSPRTLTSQLIGSLVCVEGIVTKCQ